jgi:hypothetical protein
MNRVTEFGGCRDRETGSSARPGIGEGVADCSATFDRDSCTSLPLSGFLSRTGYMCDVDQPRDSSSAVERCDYQDAASSSKQRVPLPADGGT